MMPTGARRLEPGDEQLLLQVTKSHKEALSAPEEAAAFLSDPRVCTLAAFDGGELAGFAYAHLLPRIDGGTMVLLYEVEVEARFRRRGHGCALVEATLAFAEEQGADETWVLTEASNAPANALYASCGAERDREEAILWTWRAAASR